MTRRDKILKRAFDLCLSCAGLLLLCPVIVIAWIMAGSDTGASGFFRQTRIGQNGRPFQVIKLRTMRAVGGTTITTANDARITPLGAKLRRYKLDELPQLWNVLKGEMSFVGPRPDVPGYMDMLQGDDREILTLKPGVTGPASLKYRREEDILATQSDPQAYNDTVIWPDKVAINKAYLQNWSLWTDLRLIRETVLG